MNKAVLVVDPFATGRLYLDEFKSRNIDVYALISSVDLSPFFLKKFSTEGYCSVFYDTDSCIETMQERDLVAVISGCESGTYLAEKLSDLFQLNGNPSSTSNLRRDKFAMQLALKNSGLAYIDTAMVNDVSESHKIELFSTEKLVIKPVNGATSESVTLCQTKQEAYHAIKTFPWQQRNITGAMNNALLIQPFIEGDEYVVDMVAFNGEYVVASVCKYEKIKKDGHFIYHALEVLDPGASDLTLLIDYARKAAHALDFKQGPMHMEILLADTGPVMIEVGARLHGGVAPLLFNHCYSPNLLQLSVDAYLQNHMPTQPFVDRVNYGRIIFLMVEQESVIRALSIQAEKELRNLSSYKGHTLFFDSGAMVPKTVDLLTCPGIIWLSNSDAERLASDEAACRALFFTCFSTQEMYEIT